MEDKREPGKNDVEDTPRVPEKEAKPASPPPEPAEDDDEDRGFGGLPDRDLKKNLGGCG